MTDLKKMPRKRSPIFFHVSTEILDQVKSPEATCILIYSLTKPEGWVMCRDELKKRFGFGDKEISRGIDELETLNIC